MSIFEKLTYNRNPEKSKEIGKSVDVLLDEFNETKKELDEAKAILDNININLSDAENRTDQQVSEQTKNETIMKVSELQAKLEGIKSQLDEAQK